MAERIPARLSASQGRRFGLSVGGAFVVLAAIVWWRASIGGDLTGGVPWGFRRVVATSFAALGSLLFLAGLAVPSALGPVERGWMSLAHAMSRVTTPIVMGVVYFVVLTPTGLLMRLFGKNPLRHVNAGESAWVARPVGKSDLRRQF